MECKHSLSTALLLSASCLWWIPIVFALVPGCDSLDDAGVRSVQTGVASLGALGVVAVDESRPDRPVIEANLSGPKVTDKTMRVVRELFQLRTLELHDVRVTDAGIRTISHLSNLTRLTLDGVLISDEGLALVATMKTSSF